MTSHHTIQAEEYYNNLANNYDEATSKGDWCCPKKISALVGDQDYESILIIGVGTGKDISELKRLISIKHLEGIDVSEKMISFSKEKYPSFVFHHANFMNFQSFRKAQYDLIVCGGTLEFIPEFSEFFQKCNKMLSNQGRLVITYEPIIHGHKIQNKKISNTISEGKNTEQFKDFMTYRRDIKEFLSVIKNAGLMLESLTEFVSYRKLDCDIIYHLASLRKHL